ncbi:hypothetical protein [Helicobacter pylori]|uniref:hypothetical protein n=1 Tax=Helicobacter pylori TaxID=210 RepID=UPI0013CDED9F|nr:hypothetical protein [Helicobacter pylori]
MAFNHPTIQPFNHSTIQPFNHSTIQAIKQSSNHSFKQSFKQRYHTFTTFTKIYLKIPYFLLFPFSFPLLLTISLTRTATFLNHLIP